MNIELSGHSKIGAFAFVISDVLLHFANCLTLSLGCSIIVLVEFKLVERIQFSVREFICCAYHVQDVAVLYTYDFHFVFEIEIHSLSYNFSFVVPTRNLPWIMGLVHQRDLLPFYKKTTSFSNSLVRFD